MPTLPIPVGPRLLAVLEIVARSRVSVLLEGPTGIGKSEIVEQLARLKGWEALALDLSLLEPCDLLGYPLVRNGRTVYAPPGLLPARGRGILLLEELARADLATRQPALQLLSARRLQDWRLPPNWLVWATSNPADGSYQVTPLDPALRARFVVLSVTAERGAWIAWAEREGLHWAVVELARRHDGFLDAVAPRVWRYISDLLQKMRPDEPAREGLLFDLFGATIGAPWVELLCRALEGDGDGPDSDPCRVLVAYHADADLQGAVRALRRDGRTDRLARLCERVAALLTGELDDLWARRAFELRAFEALLGDLPGDLRARLQDAFAAHPVALACVGVDRETLRAGDPAGALGGCLDAWLADPMRCHRVQAVAHALARDLVRPPLVGRFRRDRALRARLAAFADRLGPGLGRPLLDALGRRRPPRRLRAVRA